MNAHTRVSGAHFAYSSKKKLSAYTFRGGLHRLLAPNTTNSAMETVRRNARFPKSYKSCEDPQCP